MRRLWAWLRPRWFITELERNDDFEYSAADVQPRRPDRLGKRGTWVAPRTGGYTPTDDREPGAAPTGPAAAHNMPVPDAVAEAIIDLCWRAQPYGETDDGDIKYYLLTKGTVHRLIGAAQGAGIPAAFRAQS